jgi:hypothetical protein
MDRKAADKLLTQALFKAGRDKLDREVVQNAGMLRDTVASSLGIQFPGIEFSADPYNDMLIDIPNVGRMAVERLYHSLNPLDLVSCRRQIATFIGQLIGSLDNLGTIASRSGDPLLLVRSADVLDGYQTRLGTEADHQLIRWPISDGVCAVAGLDHGSSYSFLTQDYLTNNGTTEQEVRSGALERLRERFVRKPPEIDKSDARTVFITDFGGIASSLLLIDDIWKSLTAGIADRVLIHVMDPDRIVATAINDPMSVLPLLDLIRSGEFPSMFPGSLFTFDDNGLRPVSEDELTMVIETAIRTPKEHRH